MSTEIKKIKLMLDYMQGPIWISDVETGEPLTGISIVDSDCILPNLNKQCCELYSNCYEFNTHEKACYFNKERAMESKDRLIYLIEQIKNRLSEINDGSFVVEDTATPYLTDL